MKTAWIGIFRFAAMDLFRRPGWATIGFLGFFLPVSALCAMISIAGSARKETGGILKHTGTHFVVYGPACEDCRTEYVGADGRGSRFGAQNVKFLPVTLLQKVRALAEVKDASPFLTQFLPWRGEMISVGGFDTTNTLAVGNTCCAASDIKSGRFLRPGERGAALLDEGFALARKLKPDDRIALDGLELTVAGVVNPGIRPAKTDIMIALEDASGLVRHPADEAWDCEVPFNLILIEVMEADMQDRAIAKIRALSSVIMSELVTSSYACFRPARKVELLEERAIGAMAIAALLLSLLLVVRNQFAAIEARRREIAVLRLTGWTAAHVFTMILSETVLLAFLGSGAGIGAGLLIAFPASISTLAVNGLSGQAAAGLILVSTMAGGAAAGLVPAILAARLRPVEAMRDE